MSEFSLKIINGTLWSVFGRFATLTVSLISSIWMARLLSPQEFGQIGIIMFFINLANVLTEGGLGGALVRKKNATPNDYSTVFVANLIFSLICFIIIYLNAQAVAHYYNDPLLQSLLEVSAFILIINAFQVTQTARLMSEMKFREYSIYTFISILVASAVAILAAYFGMGVWALVLMQILSVGINTTLLWIFEGFFFKLYFSKSSFKELYAFGVNTTLASFLTTGFDNIYQVILAKYFSLGQAGYFYQAKKFQDIPGGVITMISNGVIFASLSKLQDDIASFKNLYNQISLYFLVLIGLITSFIYLYSEPIVLILFGDQWIGAVFYMQLLAIASFFQLQEKINKVIFKVFNKTKTILHLEFIKKIIQGISIIIGVYFLDIKILVVGFVITNFLSFFLNFYISRKVIDAVNSFELFSLFKISIISIFCVLFIFSVTSLTNLVGVEISFTIPIFFIIYILALDVMKILNLKNEFLKIRNLYYSGE